MQHVGLPAARERVHVLEARGQPGDRAIEAVHRPQAAQRYRHRTAVVAEVQRVRRISARQPLDAVEVKGAPADRVRQPPGVRRRHCPGGRPVSAAQGIVPRRADHRVHVPEIPRRRGGCGAAIVAALRAQAGQGKGHGVAVAAEVQDIVAAAADEVLHRIARGVQGVALPIGHGQVGV